MRAAPVELRPGDREVIRGLVESSETSSRIVARGRIVLSLADGRSTRETADIAGVSLPTVTLWRRRYEESGLAGIGAGGEPEGTAPELERILEAAEHTLSERGFCATRIADIAEAADVAPATVIYHFGTRQEVLVRSMLFASERAAEALERALAEGTRLESRLGALIHRFVPYVGSHRHEFLLELDLLAHARQHPELLRVWEAYQERWLGAVSDLIEEGRAAGVFSPQQDVRDLSSLILAVVDGLGYQVAVGSGRLSVDEMRALITRFVAEQLRIDPALLQPRTARAKATKKRV